MRLCFKTGTKTQKQPDFPKKPLSDLQIEELILIINQ